MGIYTAVVGRNVWCGVWISIEVSFKMFDS
jgi:hypothetical protein